MAKKKATLEEAKQAVDKLMSKSRTKSYKPIAIAEILYHNRVEGGVDLENLEDYRRRSDAWCHLAFEKLQGITKKSSNSRYWDQLFEIVPPPLLVILGKENRKCHGIVETYIYANLIDKSAAVLTILNDLRAIRPKQFDFARFLAQFEEDKRFKRSVDKIYEIVVYALFNAVTKHLGATVALTIDPNAGCVLADFEDFARLVLGVDREHPKVTQPARLYRVGTTNAADAGLDMWANFGPAIQVKHLTLSPSQVDDICGSLQADKIVIVCKKMEAASISAVLMQFGMRDRIRGIITEQELLRWYTLACGERYHDTLGVDLLDALRVEFLLEFPVTHDQRVGEFLNDRGYDLARLSGLWRLQNA